MSVRQKYGGEGTTGGGAQRMVVDQMRDLERQNEELTTELRDIQSELNKEKRAAENVRQRCYNRLLSCYKILKYYSTNKS